MIIRGKEIKLKDLDLYVLMLDRHYEYQNCEGCRHLLFHTSTIEEKVDDEMNEDYGFNIINAVEDVISAFLRNRKKHHDVIYKYEKNNLITIWIIDPKNTNDIQLIKDIKFEKYPHLISLNNHCYVEDETEQIDFWKIGGFHDTIATLLRHCRNYYDDYINKENNTNNIPLNDYDYARDLVDVIEENERLHEYYTFYKDKMLRNYDNSIMVEIWILENHI